MQTPNAATGQHQNHTRQSAERGCIARRCAADAPASRARRCVLALTSAIAITSLGCQSAKIGAGPEYPASLAQTRDLDIHATRNDTRIEITNTSAQAFGPAIVWVNMQYGRSIEGLAIGDSLSLSLSSFRNEFGEPFRAGGFFATNKPQTVTHVQIEHNGELIGLRAVATP